ncbi:hypothetical protein RHMOL_Rhmol13G0166700 [Rhododendron molle]|uniref:Uncharacterized protein n=1 Tax=Rhododendron molle TaxID=49168 RepID=A0ACC0L962_RHOML|nr:hypothetical protein RHMOL_Rhmol13G0166700 [Rhododendron molle]
MGLKDTVPHAFPKIPNHQLHPNLVPKSHPNLVPKSNTDQFLWRRRSSSLATMITCRGA